MRARALTGGLLGLLTACQSPAPAGGLPDTLAAVLATPDGSLVSVLVELPRPGVDPIVRLAPGAVGVDQGWALAWMKSPLASGGAESSLLDLSSETRRMHVFPDGVTLVSLGKEGAIVDAGGTRWRVQPDGAGIRLEPGSLVAPGGSLTHPGPAGGFGARVEGGRLELKVPREDAAWTTVLHDVDRLIGAWWFVEEALAPWQRRVVDDRFKQVGIVRAQPGSATVDGDLAEWRGQLALRVDEPSQLLVGHAGWHGPRDGGMGVAGRRVEDGALVLAVRVRDDAWMAGHDTMVVHTADREIHVPLAATGSYRGPGWLASVARAGWWDRGVELRLEGLPSPGPAVPALMVELFDADPGEPATLLATAPWPAAVTLGELALTPDGPTRPAPR
ncbi:hypothetical protein L6R53_31420 [Myxococcota bacterium]|nr:hypothetical protein [Myxococcota bacterium]